MTGQLSGAGTRVVLVGTGHHDAAFLPLVPAVPATVAALKAAFVRACGVPEENVTDVVDPADRAAILTPLREAAGQATDVLVFYYVGHGLRDPSGTLHLATRQTSDDHLMADVHSAGVPAIAALLDSFPRLRKIVVLDSCFGGRAELPLGRNGALLTAAGPDGHALAPEGADYTTFSGALVKVLRQGDPEAPGDLRLRDVADALTRTFTATGDPVPELRVAGDAGDLVLTGNVAYRRREPARREPGGDAESCPYRGLARYTEADASLFAGREALVESALDTLRTANGLTIVAGPSGSGKSSLLSAGLIPAVRAGRLGGTPVAPDRCLRVTPGEDPLGALAAGLAGWSDADATALRAAFAADPAAVRLAIGGAPAMIVVDQFEEAFLGPAARVRTFVSALRRAAGPSTHVVLGLRADFLGHCAAHPDLVDAQERSTVVVRPMTAAQLRAAIEEPARRRRFTLEPGLVDLLLRDTGADPDEADRAGYHPGMLPLLSQALLRTWQNRDGRELTLDGYIAAKRVEGALASAADEVFGALPAGAREAAPDLLLSMVRFSDGAPETRRRIPVAGLTGPAAEALEAFVRARLVTADETGAQFTHDALLLHWPRLREWINESRARLVSVQQVEGAAGEWAAAGRDPGRLYRGGRLAEVRAAIGATCDLSRESRDFLASSAAHQRRTDLVRRLTAGALAVLTVVATTTAVLAYRRGDRLERELRSANAQSLAGAATTEAARRPVFATRLALAAWRSDPDVPDARTALAGQFLAMRSVGAAFDDLTDRPITGVLSSADGAVTVLSDATGFTVVTGLLSGSPASWRLPAEGSRVVLSADGRWLASTRVGAPVALWDLTSPAGEPPGSAAGAPIELPGSPVTRDIGTLRMTFSPDGSRLLRTDVSGANARLWDLTAAPARMPLAARPFGPRPVEEVRFTSDPTRVLVVPAGNTDERTPETRALADGGLVHRFAPGATSGGGDWVFHCDGTEPFTVDVRSAVTGERHPRFPPRQPECYFARTIDGDHLLASVPSVSEPYSRIRVTSLRSGESYDYVVPYRSGSLAVDDELARLDFVDVPGGPPVALLGIDRAVLRLTPVARNPLTVPGRASSSMDGRSIVVRSDDGGVDAFDLSSGEAGGHLARPASTAQFAAFNPEGEPWFIERHGTSWQVTDYRLPGLTTGNTYRLPGTATEYEGSMMATTLQDTGRLAAIAGDTVSVWDRATGRMEVRFSVAVDAAQRKSFTFLPAVLPRPGHPDEVAVYANDERVQLWRLSGPERLGALGAVADKGSMEFDATGEHLIHLTEDRAIEVWDVGSGARTSSFTTDGAVELLGATPDGYLVTKGSRGTGERVTLWDPVRRTESGVLQLSGREFQESYDGAGDVLSLGGVDVMPAEVPLTAERWVAALCRAFGGGFTGGQRAELPDGAPTGDPCVTS
ncbi:caspase family protein [Actinoplanes sp. NPDC051861]|uniref:caspase, EACC1-associated type n=1 Tax=Actinoplanes sp. NPDC051861 TaxID=3155170 RepID=UPI0034451A4F